MTFIARYGYLWRDAQGFTGQTNAYVAGATQTINYGMANDVAVLWPALTNAAIIRWTGALDQILDPNVYGVAADYLSATFRAEMVFNTAEGSLFTIGIPSPKRSIFLPDGETVDASNAAVAAFITQFLTPTGGGTSVTKSGDVVLQYVIGKLVKRKLRRKETIWSLAPDLTGPGE